MELNHRLQVLEGEMKIVKGEVKEILAEIRAFLLNKDNPFAMDAGAAAIDTARIKKELLTEVKSLIMTSDAHLGAVAMGEAPAMVAGNGEAEKRVSVEMAGGAPAAAAAGPAAPQTIHVVHAAEAPSQKTSAHVVAQDAAWQEAPTEGDAEQTQGRLHVVSPGPAVPRHEEPERQWNLLTISNLALWAEEAVKRIGPKRLEMMLELCEIGGRIDGETKAALLKVIDSGAADPARAPTSNESLLTLRELEALLHDEQLDVIVGKTTQRSAPRRRR